jgi:hypothetical protein
MISNILIIASIVVAFWVIVLAIGKIYYKRSTPKLDPNKEYPLTDWYQPDQKPVRSGVYEVHYGSFGNKTQYAYYDVNEGVWFVHSDDKDGAVECTRYYRALYQDFWFWRGISVDPSTL